MLPSLHTQKEQFHCVSAKKVRGKIGFRNSALPPIKTREGDDYKRSHQDGPKTAPPPPVW